MNQVKPEIPKIRLYVPQEFAEGASLTLDQEQTHYLANVMRQSAGGKVGVFNGTQGEWLAEVVGVEQRLIVIKLDKEFASQKNSPDIWLAFAPLKNKLDIVVEKAVELGVTMLMPVYTVHTIVKMLNHEKLHAYIIGAAEQCGRHDLPQVKEYGDIGALLATWPKDRVLLYGDETGGGEPIKNLLTRFPKGVKYGVLVGPEGGFCPEELKRLRSFSLAQAVTLGPRILRADTAIMAALACVQAWCGDWDEKPHYVATHAHS